MGSMYRKWCINGCGKTVTLFKKIYKKGQITAIYKCDKCKAEFTKKQLFKLNTIRKTDKEVKEEDEKRRNEIMAEKELTLCTCCKTNKIVKQKNIKYCKNCGRHIHIIRGQVYKKCRKENE